ncbi:hypothetical protein SAMN04488105_1305 [Salipiger thiooxidans]|uniref:Secreted protein n=1 Tax=Salipiger thiooxidans TaxID=282683 RepID=A0A1G7M5Y6_9RHOB|nr:hypothetical protein SAMN04488105_1305 [Salipiger thiooxidans]
MFKRSLILALFASLLAGAPLGAMGQDGVGVIEQQPLLDECIQRLEALKRRLAEETVAARPKCDARFSVQVGSLCALGVQSRHLVDRVQDESVRL